MINKKKCDGCGECVDVCSMGVLEIKGKKKSKKCVIVNPDECIECKVCEATCPNGAISFP